MADAKKWVVRRFVEEVQTNGNFAVIDGIFADDFVDRTPMGYPPTREGIHQLMTALRAAMPDMEATIHTQLESDDRVVTHRTLTGTQTGELFGVPPTGKKINIEVMDILRFHNGRIVEHWGAVDRLGMMQQLGVVPAPA
jgi:steroid delta-isomerase-like uncharacterized protein